MILIAFALAFEGLALVAVGSHGEEPSGWRFIGLAATTIALAWEAGGLIGCWKGGLRSSAPLRSLLVAAVLVAGIAVFMVPPMKWTFLYAL